MTRIYLNIYRHDTYNQFDGEVLLNFTLKNYNTNYVNNRRLKFIVLGIVRKAYLISCLSCYLNNSSAGDDNYIYRETWI